MVDIVRVGTDQNSLSLCASVLRAAFPRATRFSPEYLRWQYADNPVGSIVGFNAVSVEGTLAAHYVCLPIVASIEGVLESGLLSLNTATHPDHQGKGLFTKLAQATYALGLALGYSFVVGVANQNSTGGFVRKLGFELVSPLDAKIGIGPLHLSSPRQDLGFRRHWDERTLRWRLSNPAATYAVTGSVISCATDRPLINAIIGTSAFTSQLQTPRSSRAPFHLWIGRDPAVEAGHNYFYMDIPKRFRPSPLNFIFLDLSGAGRRLNASRLAFWAVDFDAY